MQWADEGIVLALRRHGETSVIADVLTEQHGRFMGLVRGGRSRVQRPVLQPGNSVSVTWRARIEEHLGSFVLEPVKLRAASLIDDPLRLAAMMSLCELCQLVPEREAHARLYAASLLVLDGLSEELLLWGSLLVRWELGLLDELGFGLDLSACAATGQAHDLAYISPRTGRAVSRDAGQAWKDKLLILPEFLLEGWVSPAATDIMDGFKLTGYFLDRHVTGPRGLALPEARGRLVAGFGQSKGGE